MRRLSCLLLVLALLTIAGCGDAVANPADRWKDLVAEVNAQTLQSTDSDSQEDHTDTYVGLDISCVPDDPISPAEYSAEMAEYVEDLSRVLDSSELDYEVFVYGNNNVDIRLSIDNGSWMVGLSHQDDSLYETEDESNEEKVAALAGLLEQKNTIVDGWKGIMNGMNDISVSCAEAATSNGLDNMYVSVIVMNDKNPQYVLYIVTNGEVIYDATIQ